MKNYLHCSIEKFHIKSIRSFITLVVSLIVAVSLLCTGGLFYSRTVNLLKAHYKSTIVDQLLQISNKVEDKTKLIDSIFPQIMSNSFIREELESAALNPDQLNYYKKPAIEKQLRYLMLNNYLWNEKFLNAVYILDHNDGFYSVTLHNQKNKEEKNLETLSQYNSSSISSLEIKTGSDESQSIYFIRNIFSTYTGHQIAKIIIDVNQDAWIHSYMENIDENWSIFLLTQDMKILGKNPSENFQLFFSDELANNRNRSLFHETTIEDTKYFMAEKQIGNKGITSVVIAPKDYLYAPIYKLQNSFLVLFCIIIFITILFSIGVSIMITHPIKKMIHYVKKISKGEHNIVLPTGMYTEFNEFADAFHYMLKQLDLYYTELYEKQILLKNAQIQSLQAQISPHFLFNVLDTIAWKSAMTENEEIYQMIVSLGEMLRFNTLAKEKDFVPLEDEIKYVKFYIYLQQMRFEDKFSVELLIDPSINRYLVPRFSIQPLVENAIVHGLEPKAGTGKLCVNVIYSQDTLEIIVLDNGVGFNKDIKIEEIKSSSEDSHTHIGLKNLDKRLSLLFNTDCHLIIQSIPNQYTAVSFKIPKITEVI